MKMKIVGVLICMLLITTSLHAIGAINKASCKSFMEKSFHSLDKDEFQNENKLLYGPELVAKLVSPTGNCEDFFGHAISMVNDMLWVGSPRDDTVGDDVGAVYTYIKIENTWKICDIILPSDVCDNNDFIVKHFGYSIAVDPDNTDVVVIGSPCSGINDTGAVYVFYRDSSGQWIEQEKLNPPASTPENSRFGSAVDIDNNKIIIGAPTENNIFGNFVGNAYIYEKDNYGNWIFKKKLFPSFAHSGAIFGSSVAINENTILVGSPYLGAHDNCGYVFVFTRLDTGWHLEQVLNGINHQPRDRFGGSVDIVGDIIAVGSPRDGVPPYGLVNIFKYESSWVPIQEFSAPNPTLVDRFGSDLIINKHNILVSAPNHNNKGAVFLYDFIDDEAVFNCMIIAPDGMNLDCFGRSIALSSYTAAIGAYLHDANATDDGAVYVFEWNQPPYIPSISGPAGGKAGEVYDYTFVSIDSNNDELYYYIEWGDGSVEEWIGPYESGEEFILSHSWINQDKYMIKAKTKDIHGLESEWGYFELSMPKNKPFNFNFNLLSWFFERFPNAFPILRNLLEQELQEPYDI